MHEDNRRQSKIKGLQTAFMVHKNYRLEKDIIIISKFQLHNLKTENLLTKFQNLVPRDGLKNLLKIHILMLRYRLDLKSIVGYENLRFKHFFFLKIHNLGCSEIR